MNPIARGNGVGRGVVLMRGEADGAQAWVRRGLVSARVVPMAVWTAVVPVPGPAWAAEPYDDALTALASRPVGSRLAPALGLFELDGRAVLTVHAKGWRAVQRWLVWQPGHGPVRTPALPVARPSDLLRAAGASPRAGAELSRILRSRQGSAATFLSDVSRVLGLPGEHLLVGGPGGAGELVEPDRRSVARFDAYVREDVAERSAKEQR